MVVWKDAHASAAASQVTFADRGDLTINPLAKCRGETLGPDEVGSVDLSSAVWVMAAVGLLMKKVVVVRGPRVVSAVAVVEPRDFLQLVIVERSPCQTRFRELAVPRFHFPSVQSRRRRQSAQRHKHAAAENQKSKTCFSSLCRGGGEIAFDRMRPHHPNGERIAFSADVRVVFG